MTSNKQLQMYLFVHLVMLSVSVRTKATSFITTDAAGSHQQHWMYKQRELLHRETAAFIMC